MINEVRTLLLNISGAVPVPATYPGEEFVPTDFTALTLPQGLQSVRPLLFGYAPDRAFMNYRLRQFMSLLHGTRLETFVFNLDPRVTYWPVTDTTLYNPASYVPAITKLGATTADLYIQNYYNATSFGVLKNTWNITVLDGSNVSIIQTEGGNTNTTATYSITSGISSIVAIPNSPLSFFFQSGVGSMWTLSTLFRPAFTLAQVLANVTAGLTDTSFNALFSVDEPYLTFQNLWLQRQELPLRLGAILLALTYRMHELANG
jgi:hypothetical protein